MVISIMAVEWINYVMANVNGCASSRPTDRAGMRFYVIRLLENEGELSLPSAFEFRMGSLAWYLWCIILLLYATVI